MINGKNEDNSNVLWRYDVEGVKWINIAGRDSIMWREVDQSEGS